VAAWHIEYMARLLKTDAKIKDYDRNKTMPHWDELDLSEDDRKKLEKVRITVHVDAVKAKDAAMREKLIEQGVIEK
jgi:hypothetical protein